MSVKSYLLLVVTSTRNRNDNTIYLEILAITQEFNESFMKPLDIMKHQELLRNLFSIDFGQTSNLSPLLKVLINIPK